MLHMRNNGRSGASDQPGPRSDARYTSFRGSGYLRRRCLSISKVAILLRISLQGFPTVSREPAIQAFEEAKHLLLARI